MTAFVKRLRQLLFCIIPGLNVTQISSFGSSTQLQFEFEIKYLHVDALQKVQAALNLVNDLVLSAENMSIVLLEATNSSQSS